MINETTHTEAAGKTYNLNQPGPFTLTTDAFTLQPGHKYRARATLSVDEDFKGHKRFDQLPEVLFADLIDGKYKNIPRGHMNRNAGLCQLNVLHLIEVDQVEIGELTPVLNGIILIKN